MRPPGRNCSDAGGSRLPGLAARASKSRLAAWAALALNAATNTKVLKRERTGDP